MRVLFVEKRELVGLLMNWWKRNRSLEGFGLEKFMVLGFVYGGFCWFRGIEKEEQEGRRLKPHRGWLCFNLQFELMLKLHDLNVRDVQHVIIQNHIHVPKAIRTSLSFGSFDAGFTTSSDIIDDSQSEKFATPDSVTPAVVPKAAIEEAAGEKGRRPYVIPMGIQLRNMVIPVLLGSSRNFLVSVLNMLFGLSTNFRMALLVRFFLCYFNGLLGYVRGASFFGIISCKYISQYRTCHRSSYRRFLCTSAFYVVGPMIGSSGLNLVMGECML